MAELENVVDCPHLSSAGAEKIPMLSAFWMCGPSWCISHLEMRLKRDKATEHRIQKPPTNYDGMTYREILITGEKKQIIPYAMNRSCKKLGRATVRTPPCTG